MNRTRKARHLLAILIAAFTLILGHHAPVQHPQGIVHGGPIVICPTNGQTMTYCMCYGCK